MARFDTSGNLRLAATGNILDLQSVNSGGTVSINTVSNQIFLNNGGGVGIGYSLHAGQVTVADGTEMMAKRIERVLTTDPGMGVIRHVDAGYAEAAKFAGKKGVKVPMSR